LTVFLRNIASLGRASPHSPPSSESSARAFEPAPVQRLRRRFHSAHHLTQPHSNCRFLWHFREIELTRLNSKLTHPNPSPTKYLRHAQEWWAGHFDHVHSHHANEDEIMNPVIRSRVNYPAKLEADHEVRRCTS
jgi:hypothetical protein